MNDLISRQAAIDALIDGIKNMGYLDRIDVEAILGRLPSVTPDVPQQTERCKVYGGFCGYPIAWCCECPAHEGAKQRLKQRWIPCNERLPKQGQEVICQCRANIIKVLKLDADGAWYEDAKHCYMYGFVIAWMPLPEPYREER